ncbi:MAG: ABC-2 family transporter protein [Chloroflexota bacterium]|nr:ABC-2 family transporter protein [Chloroflexota bacterium]
MPSAGRDEFSLYLRFIAARVRGQMQYRASFILDIISTFLANGLELAGIFILFHRFSSLGGWSVGEIVFLYALVSISFAFHEVVAQSFEDFSLTVRQGEFDRILLRPITPIVQVLASDFQLKRLGRALTGVLALVLALTRVHVIWTIGKLLYLPVVILSGVFLFAAIDLIGGTLCFWTIERSEVINVFTYGGVFLSSYPISIYQAWIRRTFTFLIPIAFVAYYPGLYFLDRTDPLGLPRFVSFLTPAVTVAFCAVALWFWEWGVRQYQSTGS